GLGVAEPDITRQGRTVVVQLPGVKDRTKAEKLVGTTAKLEFRPVTAATQVTPPTTTPTTKPKSKTTAKSKPKAKSTKGKKGSTTTTTAPKATSTTKPQSSGSHETGIGVVGAAPGEGALPVQLLPGTTTTAPTTTAPPSTTAPATTTTAPGATTTTAVPTPTTAPAAPGSAAACGSGVAVGTTATGQFLSDDGTICYTLGPVGFAGEALKSADAVLSSNGSWAINVEVRGKDGAAADTAMNACFSGGTGCPSGITDQTHGAIAIVLDGKVLSAPAVQSSDLATQPGGFQITGNFNQSRANDLALVLRYGSLPVVFERVDLQQVSATLGKDSLRAGLIAGAIGIALIAMFMVLYYRGLGLVVVAGTCVWGALMWGIVCWLSASHGLALTLAGITGIIVSVGTTVDSYIVYFERVKDDLREGKSVRSATERGFQRALRTIVTANVSSFIGAFLLWWLTVGPVRGFAFFLGLSTLLDMTVIYLFARPVVILMGRSEFFVDTPF
ncbi:MAG TPA: SecD/SecF family protein translocase subunit, partial [Acidimicrobiales bacterium]